MTTADLKTQMRTKLESAGIGFERIQVFGVIRCNVHVTCVSRDTADKWAALLGAVFAGARVKLVPHRWNAEENKGTSMRPTMRDGWLIAVAA